MLLFTHNLRIFFSFFYFFYFWKTTSDLLWLSLGCSSLGVISLPCDVYVSVHKKQCSLNTLYCIKYDSFFWHLLHVLTCVLFFSRIVKDLGCVLHSTHPFFSFYLWGLMYFDMYAVTISFGDCSFWIYTFRFLSFPILVFTLRTRKVKSFCTIPCQNLL